MNFSIPDSDLKQNLMFWCVKCISTISLYRWWLSVIVEYYFSGVNFSLLSQLFYWFILELRNDEIILISFKEENVCSITNIIKSYWTIEIKQYESDDYTTKFWGKFKRYPVVIYWVDRYYCFSCFVCEFI